MPPLAEYLKEIRNGETICTASSVCVADDQYFHADAGACGSGVDCGGLGDGAGWEKAEEEAKQFRESTTPERRDDIAASLGQGTRRVYRKVRDLAPPLLGDDRTLDGDIRAVRGAVERNGLM